MSVEIERKFLVRSDAWRELVTARKRVRQAYLARDGKASIRVRIVDDRVATLSIKSRPAELRRLELEYPLPLLDAERLMLLRSGAVIEKIRHIVPIGDLTWEVDTFLGDNAGLIIAEVELTHTDQTVAIEAWIGHEITGQARYYNSALAQLPFRSWVDAEPTSATAGR
ncbi:CYTH domain-containing protein [Xanthobacteraceae bacterium Astr-EGSB]|uniref:CYTH domain-containing protein n=1 Tax=Astrobacterium formosum TaxID=3069710 RepID=UPI0027B0E0D4|nr:CYTH domain-containing protein [Xanthobacteraceae bacterium Astr-EGSB]